MKIFFKLLIIISILLCSTVTVYGQSPFVVKRGETTISIYEGYGVHLVDHYSIDNPHFMWGRFYPNPTEEKSYVSVDKEEHGKLTLRTFDNDLYKMYVVDSTTGIGTVSYYVSGTWDNTHNTTINKHLLKYINYIKEINK